MNLLTRLKDKKIYFFSDTDLDGVSARAIAEYYIKPIAKRFYVTNSAERDMKDFNYEYMKLSDIILFTDIAPTPKLLEEMYNLNKIVIICDHHISSYEQIRNIIKEEDYYFTTEKCGTKILFDALTEKTRLKKVIYQFVELVNCYDLWDDNSISWKQATRLNHVLMETVEWFNKNPMYDKYEKFVTNQLYKFNSTKTFHLTAYEEELADNGTKKVQTNYDQAKKSMKKRIDNSNQKYAYCECNSKMSLVSNRLLKENSDIDYFVFHSVYKEQVKNDPNGKISLRSQKNSDTNVALIAEKWNGGGHKNASGCELSLEDFEMFRKGKIHLI